MSKIIPYTASNSVEEITIPAWKVIQNGTIHLNEDSAKWAACTHIKCGNCDKLIEKRYTLCNDCRDKIRISKYNELPERMWNGETPIYSNLIDQYFFSASELEDWCKDEDLEFNDIFLKMFEFVHCKEQYYYELDPLDIYSDIIPEDGDIPDELKNAFDKLNAEIKNFKIPASWYPIDVRACLHTTSLADWFKKTHSK
jgi:hypothetical protein